MTQALTLTRPVDGIRRRFALASRRAVALVRAYPRGLVGLGVLTMLGVGSAVSGVVVGVPGPNGRAHAAAPAPPPLVMRDLVPEQAAKLNATVPVASGPNPVARPFRFKGDSAARGQALQCLASAVYYEAGSEDLNGERAVAQVILNRVRHPAFPASVCGVVYQGSTRPTGCQFTFTCDGSLYRQPDSAGWRRAYRVAEAAISGAVYAPVGWATHYHANYVVPYWASSLVKNAVVGVHIFYRWSGGWSDPGIFSKTYLGREPNALALRNAALAADRAGGPPASVAEVIRSIPGAEPIRLAPSMRGDTRVAVRFNREARKASSEIAHQDYTQKFAVSDNLKWSLSGEPTAVSAKPLGNAASPAPGANDSNAAASAN